MRVDLALPLCLLLSLFSGSSANSDTRRSLRSASAHRSLQFPTGPAGVFMTPTPPPKTSFFTGQVHSQTDAPVPASVPTQPYIIVVPAVAPAPAPAASHASAAPPPPAATPAQTKAATPQVVSAPTPAPTSRLSPAPPAAPTPAPTNKSTPAPTPKPTQLSTRVPTPAPTKPPVAQSPTPAPTGSAKPSASQSANIPQFIQELNAIRDKLRTILEMLEKAT